MKTKGKRNKFFKCLEPLGAVDGSGGKSKRSPDYSLGSGQGCGGGGGGDFIPGFFKLSSSQSSNDKTDNSRGSISRVFKAVLFEKSLLRKFRKKGSSNPTFVPSTSSNSSPETDHKTMKLSKEKSLSKDTWGTDDQFLGGNSSDSSDTSLFSSSTTTSSATSSRSASERRVSPPRSVTLVEPKQSTSSATSSTPSSSSSREPLVLKPSKLTAAVKEPVVRKQARPVTATVTVTVTKRYNSNVIMCFIVVSLMALVFWGKALAIVCTSAWFYMAPRSFENEIFMTKIVDQRMPDETSPSRRLASS